MKKNKILKSLLISTLFVTALVTTVSASGTAGSNDDPIVTKSYVDSQINSVLSAISNGSNSSNNSNNSNTTLSDSQKKALVEEITNQVVALIDVTSNNNSGNDNGSGFIYTPVQLKNGQVLIGEEGTEIILRSGGCVSYVTGSNGLANVTTGAEVMNNENISSNNVLIVPRGDGRGVKATTDTAWFIIKGGYSITWAGI